MLILGHAVFSGCQSSAEKMDSANQKVEDAREDLKDAQQDASVVAVKVANAEEWAAFKAESEIAIKDNQVRIDDLKIKMKKPGQTFDAMYARNIENLEQKNKDLKTRIGAYEANQSDWESFKREFNHDMDELGKALRDLTVNNKN
jgi:chromosome segregation ATPase